MKYNFPIIETINDVLPHIAGRTEFIVAEREDYTVINYMVNMPDTFDIDESNPLTGLIRRECRGLIFDKSGYLISRPYHKFFNIGEREETQVNKIDFTVSHTIMEKLDGSMVRPLMFNNIDKVHIATKMGLSDVAAQSQEWFDKQSDKKINWTADMFKEGFTPIFEWVSPNNRIVIHYDSDDMVITAIRENRTGIYHSIEKFNPPFNIVPSYGSLSMSISDYIEKARKMTGREGDIIRFSNGDMFKLKNDNYVRIHKTKDMIRSNRHIVALMLDNQLDDIFPHLDAGDLSRVKSFEIDFWNSIDKKVQYISEEVDKVIEKYSGDRKRIAIEEVPKLVDKTLSAYIYGKIGGKNIRDMVMDTLNKNMNADIRFEEFWQWIKIVK